MGKKPKKYGGYRYDNNLLLETPFVQKYSPKKLESFRKKKKGFSRN